MHNTALEYDEAETFCVGLGARLVEFWDETESDLVRFDKILNKNGHLLSISGQMPTIFIIFRCLLNIF